VMCWLSENWSAGMFVIVPLDVFLGVS